MPSLKQVTYAIVAAGCGAGLLAARLNGAASTPACDPDNAGLTLPSGFCASLVAEGLGTARHLVAAPNGDVYVALRRRPATRQPAAAWWRCATRTVMAVSRSRKHLAATARPASRCETAICTSRTPSTCSDTR